MTSRIPRSALIAAVVLAAMPLGAATRRHSITPLGEATVSGVVRDAATGQPIPVAFVKSGSNFNDRNGTKQDGKYTLTIPAGRQVLITAGQFSYESQTIAYPAGTTSPLDFNLTPKPVVAVKLTNGETHILDLSTSSFAYAIPFSGYARTDSANFCKTDGSAFAPSKYDIAKILGPPTSVNFGPCCSSGAILTINVEMKSGEKLQVYFNDSCAQFEVDFLGRERSNGQYLYTNFLNIAEIDFP